MCENGPFLAAKFNRAGGGGGITEITLLVRLALRGLRPCVAQERQQFLFWSRCTLPCLTENAFKKGSGLTTRGSTTVTCS